jgi:hypothetical protein
MLVEQIEQARNALIDAVLEEGVGRQIGKAGLDRLGYHAAGPGDRLAAGFEHQREADGEPRLAGPEFAVAGHSSALCIGHGWPFPALLWRHFFAGSA